MYSDSQLLLSLSAINRNKFEQNYIACKNEIEKRKANGVWGISEADTVLKDKELLLKFRKILKVLALLQTLGGILGVGQGVYTFVNYLFFEDKLQGIDLIWLTIVTLLFTFTTFTAWNYWRTQSLKNSFLQIMIALQIPAFSVYGFGYEFFSGFKLPIGYANSQIFSTVFLGSDFNLLWGTQAPLAFSVNVGALIFLVLLSKTEDLEKTLKLRR